MILDVPERWLEERRRIGADRRDELWEGELHMVPPPSGAHQRLGTDLFLVLAPLARARGLLAWYDSTGLFRPGVDDDYRVPDHVYARPELATERGVDGPAELVVEIRSPADETDAKLSWYAALGVGEVLVVDPPSRTAEVYLRRADQLVAVAPGPDGVAVGALGAVLATVAGPRLRVSWDGGSADL